MLRERFAAVRVRHAGGNVGKARLRPEQWLLIEWPAGDAQPSKYVLSTLPEDTPTNELVSAAHQRWTAWFRSKGPSLERRHFVP